jgi:hypothetical protein
VNVSVTKWRQDDAAFQIFDDGGTVCQIEDIRAVSDCDDLTSRIARAWANGCWGLNV